MSALDLELEALKNQYSIELTKDEALELARQAAELMMKALSLAQSKPEKSELRERCSLLLDKAERIKRSPNSSISGSDELLSFKPSQPTGRSLQATSSSLSAPIDSPVQPTSLQAPLDGDSAVVIIPMDRTLKSPESTRGLTLGERIILLKGSKLHGSTFRPWESDPKAEEFELKQDGDYFLDDFVYKFSESQTTILDNWLPHEKALPPPLWQMESSLITIDQSFAPTMKAIHEPDFVQDAATDCSFVASLAAATTRARIGHSKIISSVMFPCALADGLPQVSPNGKYKFRLNFNGCLREVVIDNRLPVSKANRLLHVVDRNNPSLLWPALLEKAYLKIRGGYDFPGSNSGTDLWILFGWIPEQIFLQHNDTVPSALWAKMLKSYNYGDVIVTMGTGKMTVKAEKETGLAGEHDYAVLELKELDGKKMLLVKNPWLNATDWKGHSTMPSNADNDRSDGGSSLSSSRTAKSAASINLMDFDEHELLLPPVEVHSTPLNPGTFWMPFDDVLQYFESIYLNWNPGLFKHRQDIHFSWDLTKERSAVGSFMQNPQHVIRTTTGGLVWLLLSKHFVDLSPGSGEDGFISLSACHGRESRMHLTNLASKQGVYVDSPQTLLALELSSKSSVVVATSEEELASRLHAFTISAFSTVPLSLEQAEPAYQHRTQLKSAWTEKNAGGNATSPTYVQNPQYSLDLPSTSDVLIVLETLTPHINLHVKLLHSGGDRMFTISRKDIVMDSGEYRRGVAIAQLNNVMAGAYTIICSTFEKGQLADFVLFVESNTRHLVAAIVREGAGRIRTKLADASFRAGACSLAAPIVPLRLVKVNFTAKHASSIEGSPQSPGSGTGSAHSPTRLTIEQGRGPNREIIISSGKGEFVDPTMGMRTDDVNLNPRMTGRTDMWLVLERLSGFDEMRKVEERIAVEMFADAAQAVSIGVWREWDR